MDLEYRMRLATFPNDTPACDALSKNRFKKDVYYDGNLLLGWYSCDLLDSSPKQINCWCFFDEQFLSIFVLQQAMEQGECLFARNHVSDVLH